MARLRLASLYQPDVLTNWMYYSLKMLLLDGVVTLKNIGLLYEKVVVLNKPCMNPLLLQCIPFQNMKNDINRDIVQSYFRG